MAWGRLTHTQRSLTIGLALVPMLLWPAFVRIHCCCAELQQLGLQLKASQPLVECEQTFPPCESTTTYACPLCSASECPSVDEPVTATEPSADIDRESLSRSCDCRVELLATAVHARVELPRSDDVPAHAPLCCLSDHLLSGVGTCTGDLGRSSEKGFQTSHQRCALLCCWLK